MSPIYIYTRTRILTLCLAAVGLAGCGMIDDDLSDCADDYTVDYELRLVTNITTELETKLSATADQPVKAALRNHLRNIFTDYAHDVDLSFYDTAAPMGRRVHEQKEMEANQRSYAIELPARQYLHLAVANVRDNGQVTLSADDTSVSACLRQAQGTLLPPHRTGLFAARLPMEVRNGQDQTFDVRLYMVNCAAALVLDTARVAVDGIRVEASGFATAFNLKDSIYTYEAAAPAFQADEVGVGEGTQAVFCSVSLPSAEDPATRLVIETEEPFVATDAADALWKYDVFVTLADGSVTKTTLSFSKPLRAGQLNILKAYLDDRGIVHPTAGTNVGVSVVLHWGDAGEYEVEL